MGITCADMMKNPKLNNLKLVAGETGLARSVRWVYIAECIEDPNEAVNWIFGNELVIITGHGLKGNTQILMEMIKKMDQKNIAGIIINIGPYIPQIPPEVIELANSISLPVFELPWQIKLVDITQEICSAIVTKETEENKLDNLLENVLFGRISNENDFIKSAMHYGVNLETDCAVGILDIDCFYEYLKTNNIVSEKAIMEIKNYMLSTFNKVFAGYSLKILVMAKSDSIIFLINNTTYVKGNLKRIIEEVRNEINTRYPDLTISAGIGNSCVDINELRNSYKQAEQALKVSRCEFERNNTCFYNDLGIYLLLIQIGDAKFLEGYYIDLFRSVIDYDKSTNSKLMETFKAFYAENCNMDRTSKRLFIHKNTLKYRLQKIEKLLECDLNDIQQIIKFDIGFKVGKFIME